MLSIEKILILSLRALIDADILRYEVGAVGQDKDGNVKSFDFVKDVFDDRINTILSGSGAETYTLFLTGDKTTHRINERRSRSGGDFIPNFREALATGKVYKGTRKQDKPFHWLNLTAYILSKENVELAVGYEADDLIGLTHTKEPEGTIICTRDKDLRMVPGTHYGWECGKQPEFGPITYDSLGEINLIRGKSGNKIQGGGFKFFGAQLLTGDVVDNIGGLRGVGPIKAFELLSNCTSEREVFDTVKRAYEEMDSEHWKELLEEQCALLWIIRERNPDGSLKHFNIEEWI